MKGNLNWSDVRLFLAVARSGGLTPAARLSGTSAPTLGRRVHALEVSLNKSLFTRRATGYVLTDAGRDLVTRAEEMEAAANRIERWKETGSAARTVRISAGTWMTRFLLTCFEKIAPLSSEIVLSFVTSDRRLDIPRREADIGLRNHRPEASELAGRKIGKVAFAPYRSGFRQEQTRWIGVTNTRTPSALWVWQHHGGQIGAEVSSPESMLPLLRQGIGQGVLPCFVGDREPGLVRAGSVIQELTHDQWLTTHHDHRHDPSVRAVTRSVSRLVASSQRLFAGDEIAGEPEN